MTACTPCSVRLERGVSATKLQWPRRSIRTRDIIDIVCSYYEMCAEDLTAKGSKRSMSKPRQQAMYFIKKYCDLPLTYIAKMFNKADHTTVRHGIQTVEHISEVDKNYRRELMFIQSLIEEKKY